MLNIGTKALGQLAALLNERAGLKIPPDGYHGLKLALSQRMPALGLSDALANASIRLGLGRFTTAAEVDFAVDALSAAATRLRTAQRVTEGAEPPT